MKNVCVREKICVCVVGEREMGVGIHTHSAHTEK